MSGIDIPSNMSPSPPAPSAQLPGYRLAARFADEFNAPFIALERGATQFQRVRAACEDQRRDLASMAFSVSHTIVCGRDAAAVRKGLDAIGRGPEGVGFCGTPEQVLDALGQWADAGATRAYLQFLTLDDLDQLRLIGEEVLPRA